MRAAWLTAGTIFTVAGLIISTALLFHGFADAEQPSETSQSSFPFQGSQVRLTIDEGVADVSVTTGEAGEVLVERWVRWSDRKPAVKEEWGAGNLRLSADCAGTERMRARICEVGYNILVPPESSLEATTATAPLNLARIHGRVRVTSVSGDVHVDGVAGDLYVRSGSGDVEARTLGGERADVEVGSGGVHLVFRQPPAEVRAVVRTSGTVMVEVPRQATYDVTADAPNMDLDVRRETGAPRRIIASVPEGLVDICCD
ncbi:hypothetical protein GCM10010149_90830 [Nonomuraea roseoviolacea subsp. roseoviolacea]|uniref:DUF4097 domain-containing protein n=1 Tax=Nonomuraea roseoviolacea subsp. carminata TaxID=160689 RepID=A0ABT1K4T7_9ACTN|nr:DUF4097 domain-containing protein [Nonomuraea roseoviolacea]MCP2348624.1 hypothetical protein [Nonomuraea roseoviolacea subsp. carminata]